MESTEHEVTNRHEQDDRLIRKVVIVLFLVLTIAAIVMTILYGLPKSK